MALFIVSWMHCASPGKKTSYPQAEGDITTQETQNTYWRCLFLLFESSSRHNPGARHLAYINEDPPPSIDGINTRILTKQYRIEFCKLSTITAPPDDYYPDFNTQFVSMDVLDALKDRVKDDDHVIVLDSDTIFHRPISSHMREMITRHKVLLYSLFHPASLSINGLTTTELLKVSQEMNHHFPATEFIYSAGEFICGMGSEIAKIIKSARKGYELSLERYSQGLPKFSEEAHLFSYVYHLLGYETYTANKFIRRIWTDRNLYSDVSGRESDLIFWHLPLEKAHGFKKVFQSYRKRGRAYILQKTNFFREYRITESILSTELRLYKRMPRAIKKISILLPRWVLISIYKLAIVIPLSAKLRKLLESLILLRSLSPRQEGRIFPGLRIPFGSKLSFRLRYKESSASLMASPKKSLRL